MFFNKDILQTSNSKNIQILQKVSKPIFFVGMMGCGKSTLGSKIAEILDFDFFEMDGIIEDRVEMRIVDIFNNMGEEFFRNQEKLLLNELITKEKAIISCGGGVFADEENIANINGSAISVFINVSSSTLERRLRNDKTRPVLQGMDIKKLLLKRIPFYTQASVMVDLSSTNIDKNLTTIMQEIATFVS